MRGSAGVSIEAVVRHGKTSSQRRFCSPIAACQDRRSFRSPPTGGRATTSHRPRAGIDVLEALRKAKATAGRQHAQTVLADMLPRRLAQHLALEAGLSAPLAIAPTRADGLCRGPSASASSGRRGRRATAPPKSRSAEVSTADLDSKTMMARAVPGLYFIGECVDVTGWLGGYNFQWAWASGHVAGQCA